MVLPIDIRVECYSGYREEETPRVMHFKDRRVIVAEIVDRWLAESPWGRLFTRDYASADAIPDRPDSPPWAR